MSDYARQTIGPTETLRRGGTRPSRHRCVFEMGASSMLPSTTGTVDGMSAVRPSATTLQQLRINAGTANPI